MHRRPRLALFSLTLFLLGFASLAQADGGSVGLKVFAPKSGDVAGVDTRGWIVDLVASFDGDLASTGASPELTGPGVHANAPPFPGTFSPGANLDHFPGLVVLVTSTNIGAGPGQNVSNLFNLIGITNREDDDETEVWATWIIGAVGAFGTVGENEEATLFVAVVEGDAPNVVEDLDGDGEFDEDDLELMGFEVISNARQIDFVVNGS